MALRDHVAVRKALSRTWLRADDVRRDLEKLIAPEEDIGRHETRVEPKPRWEQVHRAPI